MKNLLPLALLFWSMGLYSQFDIFDLKNGEQWEMYQTLDNTLDGQKDPDVSIDLLISPPDYYIILAEVDPSKFVYFRYIGLDSTIHFLRKNFVYQSTCVISNPGGILDVSNTCQGPCSELYFQTRSWDTLDQDHYYRDFRLPFNDGNYYWLDSCLVTDKYEHQSLTELYFKLKFDEGMKIGMMTPFRLTLLPVYSLETLGPTIDATPYFDDSGIVNIPTSSLSSSPLLDHHVDGIPSSGNTSITEVVFQETVQDSQHIVIKSTQGDPLHFQEFTQIRPGFVGTSQTKRHSLELIMNDGNCNNLVELIGGDNTSFRYRGGHLTFGPTGCIRLLKDGSLILSESQNLHYGQNGSGMLALHQGGKINFEENASLLFDGILALIGPMTDEPMITLKKSHHLSFAKNATIDNRYGVDQLIIMMDGGTIDLTEMMAAERTKVKLVYPEYNASTNNGFDIYPNPAQRHCHIMLDKAESGRVLIYDINGGLLFENHLIDRNFLDLDLKDLQGLVFVKWVNDSGQSWTKKLVIH